MYGQLEAVTGKKRRPSYTDIINAENVYLPQKVQAKKDREFAETKFAFDEEQARIDERDAWETAHMGRKQGNKATNLGYAGLGVTALAEAGALSDLYDSIMGFF